MQRETKQIKQGVKQYGDRIQGCGLQDQGVSLEDLSRITDQGSGARDLGSVYGSQRTCETMKFSMGIVLAAACTYRIYEGTSKMNDTSI